MTLKLHRVLPVDPATLTAEDAAEIALFAEAAEMTVPFTAWREA